MNKYDFFSLLQQAFHLTLNMISPETHKAVSEVIESCRVPWELKRFCTASAFLTYQAAVFSLPGRQQFVMTRFPAAANYIKLTTSLCYSLIEPFLLLFIFGAPCFLSLLVYSFFFFLALFAPFCAGWDACIRKNDSRMKVFSLSSVHVICVVIFFFFRHIHCWQFYLLPHVSHETPLSHRWVLHVPRPLIKPSHKLIFWTRACFLLTTLG